MNDMVGKVHEVYTLRSDGNVNIMHNKWTYTFYSDTFIVVEGDLNCLKN